MASDEVVGLPAVRQQDAVGADALRDDRLAHHEPAVVVRFDEVALLDAANVRRIVMKLDLRLLAELLKPRQLHHDGLRVIHLVHAERVQRVLAAVLDHFGHVFPIRTAFDLAVELGLVDVDGSRILDIERPAHLRSGRGIGNGHLVDELDDETLLLVIIVRETVCAVELSI